jgi:phage terminase small subunit
VNLTPKQERFCTLYIELGNASEAYRGAYDAARMKPESVNRKAKELLDNGKIAARLGELKAQHVERHAVTIDTIRDMLLEDRAFAREMETAAAAVSATMGLAKLYGYLRDKLEHSSPGGSMSPPTKIIIEAAK